MMRLHVCTLMVQCKMRDIQVGEHYHKLPMGDGFVCIENLGGDLEKMVGKRSEMMAFPIAFTLMAIIDD